MASLFDKYAPVPVKQIKKITDEDDSKSNVGKRANRLELQDGQSKVRIMPKHPNEKQWMVMVCQHWVQIENKDGELTRRPVPNGRIHGNLKTDVIEGYVEIARAKYGTSDDSVDIEKLKEITDWKKGLMMSTNWMVYAFLISKTGERSPVQTWEFWRNVRDDINSEMQVEEEDEEIATDPFTHPKEGHYLLITKSVVKKKSKITLKISDKVAALTIDELTAFDKMTPLSKLPQVSYTKRDFENAVEGIRNFDEENEMGIVDSDEFKTLVKQIEKEMGGKSAKAKVNTEEEEEETETETKVVKKSAKPATKKKVVEEEEEAEEESDDLPFVDEAEEEQSEDDGLDTLDRDELKQYIVDNDLREGVGKLMKNDNDDDIREKIRAAMLAKVDEEETTEEEPEEEEEEEPAPSKKTTKPAASAAVKKSNKPTLEEINKKLNARK